MATKVVMEALSPTMEEGRLVKWLKGEGDEVAKGDIIAEVETDKAVMELVARADGVLRKHLLPEGETSPVGTTIGVIAGADEDISSIAGDATAKSADGGTGESKPAAGGGDETRGGGDSRDGGESRGGDSRDGDAGEGDAGAGDGEGHVKGGAKSPEKVIAKTKETAGATSVPPTPEDAQGEATMPPQSKTDGIPARTYGEQEVEGDAPISDSGGRPRSSPLARRLAREQGLDLQSVQGSGPGGRIVRRDIESAMAEGGARQAVEPTRAPAAAAARPAEEGDYRDTPVSQMRKTIARRLSESIGPIPTFYLTVDLDMERAIEMREAMMAMGDEFKVSVNDIVMKAVGVALSRHPEVNAHWLGDRIRYHNRVHLGMAVAVEDGLITPVLFDVDRLRLSEISSRARELAKRARDRRLKPEEYTGSTFSVSNLGMFGIDEFTAIINPPEVGILAIGAVESRAIVEDDDLVIRRRMRVTMSCDHRVVDGATGARFLQTLRRMIENPLMLVF